MSQRVEITIPLPDEDAKRRKRAGEQFDIGARRRETRPMSRRLQGSNINIYDMSQSLIGGEWTDNAYTINKIFSTYSVFVPEVAAYNVGISADGISISEINTMWDAFISQANRPFRDWKEYFRRITYQNAEDDYFLRTIDSDGNWADVDANNGRWSNSGFRPYSGVSPMFKLSGSLAFGLGGPDYKVTATRNFAAGEVSLNLAQAIDVFPLPNLNSSDIYNRVASLTTGDENRLLAGPVLLPRSYILQNGGFKNFFAVGQSQAFWNTYKTSIVPLFGGQGTAFVGNNVSGAAGLLPLSSFPSVVLAGIVDLIFWSLGTYFWESGSPDQGTYVPVGTLVAIAVQNGTPYYVWRKDHSLGFPLFDSDLIFSIFYAGPP